MLDFKYIIISFLLKSIKLSTNKFNAHALIIESHITHLEMLANLYIFEKCVGYK